MDFETRTSRARVRIALGAWALATLAWAATATAEPVGIARLLADSARRNPPSFRVVLGLTGTTVAVDSATGRLRQPTDDEMAALTGGLAAQRRMDSVAISQAADGTLTAYLGEAGLNVWIAAIGADGQLHATCVEDPAAAAAALAGGVVLEEQ